MMASNLVSVHQEPLVRVYKCAPYSAAGVWRHFSNAMIVVITLALTFASQGMWRKTNTYVEQPVVEFTRRCTFLLASAGHLDRYWYWSAEHLTSGMGEEDRFLVPVIESRQLDVDGDGKVDEIVVNVNLRFPKGSNNTGLVTYVFYTLDFNLELEYRSIIKLRPGQLIGEVNRLTAGESLTVWGDLKLNQKQPFPSHGRYESSNLNQQTRKVENDNHRIDFDPTVVTFPATIRQRNFHENYTLELNSELKYWHPITFNTQNQSSSFKLHFHLMIRPQHFTYRCSPLELLKWAWIQYVCVLVVLRRLVDAISSFLYENQIFSTTVAIDPLECNLGSVKRKML